MEPCSSSPCWSRVNCNLNKALKKPFRGKNWNVTKRTIKRNWRCNSCPCTVLLLNQKDETGPKRSLDHMTVQFDFHEYEKQRFSTSEIMVTWWSSRSVPPSAHCSLLTRLKTNLKPEESTVWRTWSRRGKHGSQATVNKRPMESGSGHVR